MNYTFRPWYYDPLFWIFFGFDWIVKRFMMDFFLRKVCVTPFLCLQVTLNRGISWSLFHSYDFTVFMAVSAVVFAILCFLAVYTLERQKEGYDVTGEILLLAGGYGNFTDRLVYGGVVDYIHFYWGRYSFPVFNVADMIITLGAMIIIWRFIFGEPEEWS